jgi:zinc protease
VADNVLGGGYSARLNEEVRVKRGLSYGARSAVEAHRDIGEFYAFAQTRNDAADQVAALMLAEVRRLAAAPPAASELEARKASLTGEFGRTAATSVGLASYLSRYAALGVDPGEVNRFTPRTRAISTGQTVSAASKVVDPAAASVVVVGDARQFLPALRQRFPKLEVIEASALDLDAPGLVSSAPGTPAARP